MRQAEDKELRDFEIRQWFYILRSQYISEGVAPSKATEQAYDDIGMRFCLRKTSIRRAKNAASQQKKEKERLMLDVKNNISRLKQVISRLESVLSEK